MAKKESYKIRFLKRKLKESQKEKEIERQNILEAKLYDLKIKEKRSVNRGTPAPKVGKRSFTPILSKEKAKIIYTPMGGKNK